MSASLCCFLSVGFLVSASAEQKIISAQSGQNVTLPCRAPNNNDIINTVEWRKPDLKPDYVLLYRDEHVDPDNRHPSFENRVDLHDKQMKDGDVSLILKNVTIDDTGTYQCRVFMGEIRFLQSTQNITLSVVPPGRSGASFGLRVHLPVFGLLFVLTAAFVV